MTSLRRSARHPRGVFGELRIEREIVCVTLEHPDKLIPAAPYSLILRWSPRFGMLVPEVVGVPDRTDIEMHPGNKMEDTEGCILTGSYKVSDEEIAQSRIAFGKFMARWREWESHPFLIEDETQ